PPHQGAGRSNRTRVGVRGGVFGCHAADHELPWRRERLVGGGAGRAHHFAFLRHRCKQGSERAVAGRRAQLLQVSQSMESVPQSHSHVFLGERHEANERKTWAVIILCGVMMLVEIVGGALFNSLALIADGLHMSTHAGAMLIAALAYTY